MFLQIPNTPAVSPITHDISVVRDWFTPLIIAGVIIFVGIVIQRGLIIYLQRLSKKNKWKGGLVIISSIRGMIILLAVLFGVYFGLTKAPVGDDTVILEHKLHKILLVFTLTFIIARVLTGLLRAYSIRDDSSKSSLSLFKSLINIIIYSIGLLVMLQSFGISITPILTALGVGGLAVALALQDTLSNLFAGVQITLTRTIKRGDYIKLSTGEEGTVTDIAWRSTSLKTQNDNIVIIPNSKLSTTIVTNFSLPNEVLNISVPFYVGFNSDLDKIEKISLEIANQITEENKITDSPVFRFKEAGDFALKCSVSFDANEFSQQYLMRHEFIKRLYKRFKQEGIEIPVKKTN